MKQLIGIRLVQFFLYEARDIRLGKTTGIFGANGSGKSSLLDAVQIVMLGASAHRGHGVVFNAQADERKSSTRSIKAYCLGQYDVTEESRVRTDATTYITLVWQDTQTQALLSTGVCIAASSQRESHEVRGRYIFHSDLTLGDHLQLVDGTQRPRDWESFREQLRQRSAPNHEPLYHDAERFVKAILLALRGDNGVAQLDAFRQAFRFGLKMGFDKSIDEIVRHQVIEARPTNVQQFRENFNLWKQIQATVAETSAKVEASAIINTHFEAARKFQRRAATWPALGKAVACEIANEAVNKAELAEAEAVNAKEKADSDRQQADTAASTAEAEARDAASRRDTHAAHTQQVLARQTMEAAMERLNEVRGQLRGTLGLVTSRLDSTLKGGFTFRTEATARQASSTIAELLRQFHALERSAVEAAVRRGLRSAKDLAEELFNIRRGIETELGEARNAVEAIAANLQRAAEGKAPLEPHVRALRGQLSNAGIVATPVCDLVEIDDTAWQPVIEAYLGPTLQTLLITSGVKEEETRAYQIYRKSSIHGVKVASSSRHENLRSPMHGSVAELIRSRSSAPAANYLRKKFGDCMRAEDERAAFSHHATLTVDGMLFRDGEFDRLKPVDPTFFRIGPVRPATKVALQSQLAQAQANVKRLEDRSGAAAMLYSDLGLIAGDVEGRLSFTMQLFDSASSHDKTLAEAQSDLNRIKAGDYEAVRAEAEAAAGAAPAQRSVATEAATAAGVAKLHLETRQGESIKARQGQADAATAAELARQVPDYDADYYAEQWDRLIEDMQRGLAEGNTLSLLQVRCGDRAQRAQSDSNSKIGDAQDALTKYLYEFRSEHLPESAKSHWTAKAEWMRERHQFLDLTELKARKEEADAALEAARNIFRNDVAVHINDRLEWLEATFDRMNHALRIAPAFTNGERYLFRKLIRPQYTALHKFILDVAQFGPGEDLLGGAGNVPPEFDNLMREQSNPEARTQRSPLDDYREFFEFDVEILREDPVTSARRRVGMLSQRVGPGSGGEHRAPLYVMAGAALASAYYAKPGDDSGLRLIVLDEAFIKMDPHNIAATMRYFEELGLQVCMASTGDALGTLTAFLDRYYDIMRDPYQNIIVLQGHDIDQKTRDMFRADMVEFHPELIDEEVERLRQPTSSDDVVAAD